MMPPPARSSYPSTMLPSCAACTDGLKSAITKGSKQRRVVAYVFPQDKTCNNRLFNDGVAATDDFKVVLHRAAANAKFADNEDLPDQLTPFIAFEVAVDGTVEDINSNDIQPLVPTDLMAEMHKRNGKNICFLIFYGL